MEALLHTFVASTEVPLKVWPYARFDFKTAGSTHAWFITNSKLFTVSSIARDLLTN